MAVERTLSIIKPNAILKNVIGLIISRFECSGLIIIGMKMIKLTSKQAKGFYSEHKNKIFFKTLIKFMISGPIIVQVLEGEKAISINRKIIGTNYLSDLLIGKCTLRSYYSDNFTENGVHGSDSKISAEKEIAYFFTEEELFSRIHT